MNCCDCFNKNLDSQQLGILELISGQREEGRGLESRDMEDTSETWKKLDRENGRNIKRYITECRLIKTG